MKFVKLYIEERAPGVYIIRSERTITSNSYFTTPEEAETVIYNIPLKPSELPKPLLKQIR